MFFLEAYYLIRGVEERAKAALSTFMINFIHLHLDLPNGLSPPSFRPKTLCLLPHTYHIACPFPPSSDHPNHI